MNNEGCVSYFNIQQSIFFNRYSLAMFSKKEFADRMAFWAAQGGKWSAANPAFTPGEDAPEGFEFHATVDLSETVMGFTIFAYMKGQKVMIWKGYHYWHELKNKSVYLSLGAKGEICNGETYHEHDMYFEILHTSGMVIHIRNHDELVNENEIKSTTHVLTNDQWQAVSTAHWKRM